MRATIRRAVEAHKAQREENGQAGFSLIELIVVVVILGILAAVAIPIFLNIQKDAADSAAKAVAGNAASQAAAAIAKGSDPAAPTAANGLVFTKLVKSPVTDITLTSATINEPDSVCVTVTFSGGTGGDGATVTAGPAANAAGTACS